MLRVTCLGGVSTAKMTGEKLRPGVCRSMRDMQGLCPYDMRLDLVGLKACNLCRVYIYSNSRVLGYGRPTGPTRQPEDVLFKKIKVMGSCFSKKGTLEVSLLWEHEKGTGRVRLSGMSLGD